MKVSSLIKRICAGVVGAGSSLIIAACYGVMYDDHVQLVYGRVTTSDGTAIPNIQVCAVVGTNPQQCTTTSYYNGEFSIYMEGYQVDEANANGFTLQARDVDGAANGTFEDTDYPVGSGQTPADVVITMDGSGL